MRNGVKTYCRLAAMAGIAAWCGITLSMPPAAPVAAPVAAPAAPATAPRASGVTIRGKLAVSNLWTIQKPDLSRVIVYLASSPALDAVPPPTAPVIVAQRNKMFDPNFAVISIGTTVEFPNLDHFYHNVFSRSAAAPAFDLSRYPYGQSKSLKFEKVGAIQLFCNIHPSMRSLIFVAPNPFFARADGDGHFQLTNVPPGEYELVVWSERCKELRQKVKAAADSPELSLSLEEDRKTIFANDPPKPRQQYGIERGLGIKREKLNLPVVEGVHPCPDCANTAPPANTH
jgi:plastocyanin